MKINAILSLVVLLTLFACGGGGGSSETPSPTPAPAPTPDPVPEVYTGVFLDSAVVGLGFETESQQGLTNDKGEFTYQAGEKVTFYIGDIRFPEIDAGEFITPLNVFNTEIIETKSVVNMLRFLQTLDLDGVPENGIQLNSEVHTLASDLMVDFDSDFFEDSVNSLLVANNAVNIAMIPEQQAIQHFESTLLQFGLSSGNSCSKDHSKVGYSGIFQTYHHQVTGRALVIDDCTIQITHFTYDGQAPDVYIYAGDNLSFTNSEAFAMSEKLENIEYSDDTLILKLPSGKTLNDFDSLSVWCVAASANFGDLILMP